MRGKESTSLAMCDFIWDADGHPHRCILRDHIGEHLCSCNVAHPSTGEVSDEPDRASEPSSGD